MVLASLKIASLVFRLPFRFAMCLIGNAGAMVGQPERAIHVLYGLRASRALAKDVLASLKLVWVAPKLALLGFRLPMRMYGGA